MCQGEVTTRDHVHADEQIGSRSDIHLGNVDSIGLSPHASTTLCEITEPVEPVSQIASNSQKLGCDVRAAGSNAGDTLAFVAFQSHN